MTTQRDNVTINLEIIIRFYYHERGKWPGFVLKRLKTFKARSAIFSS
jgi:hypothetical protein